MIVVNIKGGLGNQMFQYALARKLQIIYPNEVVNINLEYFANTKSDEIVSTFPMDLNFFNIKNFDQTSFNFRFQKPIYKLLGYYYFEKYDIRFKNYILDKKIGYFDGYWQSEKYFLEIKDQLKNEFQLKNEMWDEHSLTLLDKIRSSKSVSIHIRRGDYVKLGYNDTCGLKYYQEAINIINLKIKDPHFFIFSNDIEWVKNNLKLKTLKTYVEYTTEAQANKELLLMSSCQYNIISNSTFSWWAAWLNDYSEKIVISPKDWIVGLKQNILVDSWIKI
jgi:hypothetical protein